MATDPVMQRSSNYMAIVIFSVRFGLKDVDVTAFNRPPLIELVVKRAAQTILIKRSGNIACVKHNLII